MTWNKEKAQAFLPLVKAIADGKTVEFSPTEGRFDDWHIHRTQDLTASRSCYRIKPEPVMVPLGPEDVPPGSVIRGAGETQDEGWCLITSCSLTGIRIWKREQTETTWRQLLFSETQIKRPGEDWKPCCKPAPES